MIDEPEASTGLEPPGRRLSREKLATHWRRRVEMLASSALEGSEAGLFSNAIELEGVMH